MTVFDEETCYKCGVVFGVPLGYKANRRKDRARFWCPNGHEQAYVESSEDILRRERDRLKQQLAEKDDTIAFQRRMRDEAEADAAKQRKAVARLRKRAHAGVCSCCNRHFKNLEQHMKSQHGTAEEKAKVVQLHKKPHLPALQGRE